MKVTLIITDVTRMHGDYVCVAGLTEGGECIRPVFSYGQIPEKWLYEDGWNIIHPFSWVEFEALRKRPDPPHSEDVLVTEKKQKVDISTDMERMRFLQDFASPNVESIFDAEIQHSIGSFVREGEGKRSLGTIQVKNVHDFFYGYRYGSWDYRITFTDRQNQEYSLKVTDLSLRYYCDHLRDENGMSPDKISATLKKKLASSRVFLRIGLARPTWDKYPHCCFLQITGVYTFPDYLDGRCFADFKKP